MKGIIFTLLFMTLASCSSSKKSANAGKAFIYYSHGTEKLLLQDYTAALKNLLKADELKPDDSKTLNNLGMAYYFKQREETAIQHIKRAIEINPKNSDARNNLASIYFNQGRLELAKIEYNKVLDDLIYRHTYRVYYNLGLIDLKNNRIDSAIKNLVQAEGLKVDYCAANFQLALLHKKIKQLNKASIYFKKSVRGNCEKLVAPYYHWGILLTELGKDKEAIKKFDKVIKNNPRHQLSFMAKKRKSLIDRSSATMANKYETIETFNSGDF